MRNRSSVIMLSLLALTTTTGCEDFLEDFPIDTLGDLGKCPSCNQSTASTAGIGGSSGGGVSSTSGTSSDHSDSTTDHVDSTVSVGDATGSDGKCANPKDPSAPFELIRGDLPGNTVWTCDKIYVLDQDTTVAVKQGSLTIEAGTTIKGQRGSSLIIEKNATINAVGSEEQPIVFTSNRATDKVRGDWGGLVLLGNAIINQGVDIPAEGFPVPYTYGGTDPTHNCGTLRYVRVEWAGFALTTDHELNSISFMGCGTQTKVDHVQVHMGLDDGIEWFGGGFNAHHLIVTGAKDDSIDLDLGFTGKLQHVFIQQDPQIGDNGFEVSNNELDFTKAPVTKPLIANLTFIGSGASGQKSRAFTFKQGAKFELYNSIAFNPTNELFSFASSETLASMAGGMSNIRGCILNPATSMTSLMKSDGSFTLSPESFELWLEDPAHGNHLRKDAGLSSAAWGAHSIQPPQDGLAAKQAASLPEGFEPTNYIGAVDPAADKDWTKAAWTNYSIY